MTALAIVIPCAALNVCPMLFFLAVFAVAQAQSLAITHATVIDGRDPEPKADRTIVVRGNRIVAEGPSASTTPPRGARVIDATGRFVIPGLWDMHVHTVMPGGKSALELYVANGVTSVRDMGSDWSTIQSWRRAIAAGALVGPRIVASGPYLEGGDQPIAHIAVRTPADAQPAVDSLAKLGVDFIKVHTQLDRERYFAIARAARARHMPFVGHVPRVVGAADASDSGQRSIEHLLTIPNQCAPGETAALAPRWAMQSVFNTCATEDLAPLFAKFVKNDTWMVPTLVAQLEVAQWPKQGVPGDSAARYLSDSLRAFVAQIFPMPDSIPPDADVVGRALFAKRVQIVGAMHRAGVGIMPGTDAPLRNSPPGFGLHQELAYFVQAGMTPFETIRSATLAPARFLGLADSLGTIERGKIADLVVLAANPLETITSTTRIVTVVANGRAFDVRRDAIGHYLGLTRRP